MLTYTAPRGFFFYKQEIIRNSWVWLSGAVVAAAAVYTFIKWRHKKLAQADAYGLLAYLYGGYWCITFLYRGDIWNYYTWAFVPCVYIFIASLYTVAPKKNLVRRYWRNSFVAHI
ncbi:MAG: hypothetical protein UZ22_OP11002000944 [Microgenomates bacterium OLB23]|nr:MAG: hypothetical protein UZ22_OP11002000944 [Microgenomates bacterium OLB23]